jgi:hypothetical protein
MSKDLDNRYFIILNKDTIIFSCLNNENKISFTMKHSLINSPNNLSRELENFFFNNLIYIEKSIKDFLKKIYIIIDIDNNLNANLSIKYKLETEKISDNKINDLLNSLKYQFTKYNSDQKIIHITISKILIDGKEKNLSLIKETLNNLILEVKFECLENDTIFFLKKICSNYQISVEKILLANHLRHSFWHLSDNIVFSANEFLKDKNNTEVLSVIKRPMQRGFFERFFKFFS